MNSDVVRMLSKQATCLVLWSKPQLLYFAIYPDVFWKSAVYVSNTELLQSNANLIPAF